MEELSEDQFNKRLNYTAAKKFCFTQVIVYKVISRLYQK